jgi:hypothetical protein
MQITKIQNKNDFSNDKNFQDSEKIFAKNNNFTFESTNRNTNALSIVEENERNKIDKKINRENLI